MENTAYSKPIAEVLGNLGATDKGLSDVEAKAKLIEFGPNKLPEQKPDSIFSIFLRQFQSPLIYVLLVSAVIIFFTDEKTDAFIILGVLVFNAMVGSIQEGRAQNTLRSLKKYAETKAEVLRGGKEIIVKDEEIAPGDVIILREGEKIPADARVFLSNNLKVNESALSGESTPVNKISEAIAQDNLPLAEQKNMVFKGTNVLSGSGIAVVCATGANTVIGKIAKEITSIDSEIPLKKNIWNLSRLIILIVVVINIILFLQGLASGKSVREMFSTLVSLSVSVIPEGLPIVMTLILATGVWRMGKRNALVKKLQAVEALGQAEVIAVDKTGTITKNELVVRKVFTGGKIYDIGGLGYEPKGDVQLDGAVVEPLSHADFVFAVKNAALCSNANIVFMEAEQKWSASGDPTEAALLVLAQKIGFSKNLLDGESPQVAEFPFDYKLKYHACERKQGGQDFVVVSGAPENVLMMCSKIWEGGKNQKLSEKEKNSLIEVFEKMSADGLRVVALAIDNNPKNVNLDSLENLSFLAFFAMKDALRAEVAEAMEKAKKAGVRVVMITGDHKITARAIAMEAGIYKEGDEIITGSELELMDKAQLARKIENVSVFARVSPDHKLRIIEAFRSNGKTVAMTGDGVNDAPSLVAADLGVAMGKVGTEVAKDASDIVLLDDNFGSIISAIEEGRSIYKTIKKVTLYLFSTGISEVMVIAGSMFLGFPLPILPAQIIWLNFVTDSFLDVSLAMEPREKNLLSEKFKKPNKYLLDWFMAQRMFFMSLTMAIVALAVFSRYLEISPAKAQTMALVVMAISQWFNAWNCRSDKKSLFATNPFSNKFLIAATGIVFFFQMLAVYNPAVQGILRTVPLSINDWIIAAAVSVSVIAIEETRKFMYNLVKLKK